MQFLEFLEFLSRFQYIASFYTDHHHFTHFYRGKNLFLNALNPVTNSPSLPASCSWILSISMGVVTTT